MNLALARVFAVVAVNCLGLVASSALFSQDARGFPVHPTQAIHAQSSALPTVGPGAFNSDSMAVGRAYSTGTRIAVQLDAGSNTADISSDQDVQLNALQGQIDKLLRAEQERVEKASKQPTAKITDQLQPDYYWFDQDAANRAAVGDIQDGSAFRRARIGVVGEYDPTQY